MTLAQTSVGDAFRGRLLGLFFAVGAVSEVVGMGLAACSATPSASSPC